MEIWYAIGGFFCLLFLLLLATGILFLCCGGLQPVGKSSRQETLDLRHASELLPLQLELFPGFAWKPKESPA